MNSALELGPAALSRIMLILRVTRAMPKLEAPYTREQLSTPCGLAQLDDGTSVMVLAVSHLDPNQVSQVIAEGDVHVRHHAQAENFDWCVSIVFGFWGRTLLVSCVPQSRDAG